MALTHLGSLTLGECVPLAATAGANLNTAIGVSLPEVEAKVTGALAAQAALTLNPPSLASSLSAAQQLVVNLEAAISLGLPSASLSLTGLAAVLAELQVSLASLTASASFSASFGVTLGTPGVHAYRFRGAVGSMGNEIQNELSGGLPGGGSGSTNVKTVLLIAADGGAQAALDAMFAS